MLNIAIVSGGDSGEYEVSIKSGKQVELNLDRSRFERYLIEMTGDLTSPFTTNGITIDQNTPTVLQGHDNTPVSSSPCGFIRLHVTRP